MEYPRLLDLDTTFESIIQWLAGREAPGLIIGLSGTDSLVAFLAAYRAFDRIGKGDRVWGVHFAPSEDFLADHPEAEQHLWFAQTVMPWLASECPRAKLTVDTSIDWRMDGVRWGMLGEMAAVSYEHGRKMRAHDDRFWVVGTRNRTEDELCTYSNASLAAGLQPLVHLWKSEVLQLARHLGVPQVALDKSCEVDCICGRQRLPAKHIREIDWMLMAGDFELDTSYTEKNIDRMLRLQLHSYIEAQFARSSYKHKIPYRPREQETVWLDGFVEHFEAGTLDLRIFNHRQHLYVAWYYLKQLPLDEAIERYSTCLLHLLTNAKRSHKFNAEITRNYFVRLKKAMKSYTGPFDILLAKHPDLLAR